MQVAVLKLDVHCEKIKRKAMKTVCNHSGIQTVDVKEGKLTVTGEIDAYEIVKKLKKICHTDIISVGPVKEPEKKKPDPPKPEPKPPHVIYHPGPYPRYNYYCFNRCDDENPNACHIF